MAARKSIKEEFVVNNPREEWMSKCRNALEKAGFSKIQLSETLFQISGKYRKLTVWGEILITLLPEGDSQTKIVATATANVDNIYALFRSPTKKILSVFKQSL